MDNLSRRRRGKYLNKIELKETFVSFICFRIYHVGIGAVVPHLQKEMGLFDTFRVSDVHVTLHNPVVYPGTIVTGVMSFKATSTASMRAVRVSLIGGEHTVVIFHHSDGSKSTSRSDTVFLNQLFTVSGECLGRQPGKNHELPAGEYAIPFEFLLPHKMPPTGATSVEPSGDKAAINYGVTGTIDIPGGVDATATATLCVLSTMPFAQFNARGAGGLLRPLTVPLSCCCCISKGALTYTVRTDKNMFALDRDDPITVTVTVDASSAGDMVEALIVSLQNHTNITAESDSWCSKVTVRTVKQLVKMPSGSPSREFIVSLPTLAQGDEGRCQFPSLRGAFFHSQWFVVVDVEMSYANDSSVSIPIVAAPRVDETNQAPILEFNRQTYPAKSVPALEYVYSVPPRLRDMARGLSQLPPVTGQAAPAPYAQSSAQQPPTL